MANTGKPTEDGAFKPGTLDEFKQRFGDLEDRFEQAVHSELDRVELPRVEHPDQSAQREAAASQVVEQEPREFLPDHEVKSEFTAAAENDQPEDSHADQRGSSMVESGAPEHNLRPTPEISRAPDRQSHYERMSEDDSQSRLSMTDSYYAELEARMEDDALEQKASGQHAEQDQGDGQDFER